MIGLSSLIDRIGAEIEAMPFPAVRFPLLAAGLPVLVCLTATSCTNASSGPSLDSIVSSARNQEAGYTLVNVTQAIADRLSQVDEAPLSATFAAAPSGSASRIGLGDVVTVSIWEASSNGMFSSGNGSQMGGVQVPAQQVSTGGTIAVPYAGLVKAAGLTPQQVKAEIEKGLAGTAVKPQVLVNVVTNNSNAVTVTGEVAASGRIPLSPAGYRLLDVIALAGGPRKEPHQLAVQVTRGRKTEIIAMESLIAKPRENIRVAPGDTVTLIRQPRSFTVFGATTGNASVPFDESQLYLSQALAKVGGLNDEKANARGVFVYRREPAERLQAIGSTAKSRRPDGSTDVIYQIDLKDPNGFFILQSFKVANGDLIYVANSSLAEIRKFSTLISATVTPAVQAAAVASDFDD